MEIYSCFSKLEFYWILMYASTGIGIVHLGPPVVPLKWQFLWHTTLFLISGQEWVKCIILELHVRLLHQWQVTAAYLTQFTIDNMPTVKHLQSSLRNPTRGQYMFVEAWKMTTLSLQISFNSQSQEPFLLGILANQNVYIRHVWQQWLCFT